MAESKQVAESDLIQVNEEGPWEWFRCILVVAEVKTWGVEAYCTVPYARDRLARDAFLQLNWNEFDTLGAKSHFVALTEEEST